VGCGLSAIAIGVGPTLMGLVGIDPTVLPGGTPV
jgi:hypothetical protein